MNHTLEAMCQWLSTLRLHALMQDNQSMVPAVQTVHILAIGFVFSSSLVLALRTAHVSGIEWSPAQWGHRLNRWIGWSLLVLLLSGSVLVVGEPERELLSPIFQIKMVLVIVTGALAFWLAHRLQHLDPPERARGVERVLAILIVIGWMAVISAGRWIAYYAG